MTGGARTGKQQFWTTARLAYLRTLVLSALVFALALGSPQENRAADRDYIIGQKNFNDVLTYILRQYEDPEVDNQALLSSALLNLREREAAQSASDTASQVRPATETISRMSPIELIGNIEDDITSAAKSAREVTDATPPSTSDLWNAAISGLVEGLQDPYSQYLPPKNLEQLNDFLSGDPKEEDIFYGVGIHIDWDGVGNRGVLVLIPIPDGPADLNDIRPGDIIIGVDGEPVLTDGSAQENIERAVERIKGPKDSEVELTIFRPGCPVPLNRSLKRAPVNSRQLTYKYMLDEENGVGYLKLVNFYQHCADDVEDALIQLKAANANKVIFDLRYNPGGYLDQAVAVADLFMKEGELITYTQGRDPSKREDFKDVVTGDHGFEELDLVILINRYSASASEVVTGALHDSGRCDVVGETSFGKGSVQNVFELSGDAALRLTVAKYYTPGDRCIHETGIEPDYPVESLLSAFEESIESGGEDAEGSPDNELEETEKPHGSTEDAVDESQAEEPEPKHYDSYLSLRLDADPQLRKAYEVLMGTAGEPQVTFGREKQ